MNKEEYKKLHPIPENWMTTKEGEYITHGVYEDDDCYIIFGGNCPIEGHGIILGFDCYYRSRGSGWTMEISQIENCFQYIEAESSEEFSKKQMERWNIKTTWPKYNNPDSLWNTSNWIYRENPYTAENDKYKAGYIESSESIENIKKALIEFKKFLTLRS